jgi:signal peptide peptidase SppA
MKSPHLPPLTATAQQLLADFICSPVSMRGDRYFATVRELHALTQADARERHTQLSTLNSQLGSSEADEPMPWEEPIYKVEAGLATVFVNGPLVKGYDDFTCWWFGMMSTDRLQAALADLAADQNVRAVKLRLNTPGGVSTGMPETADQILELDTQKPVFAFTSDMAASNGYRLAAACRAILATRSAVVGSIGTYIALYDYSKMLEDMGIKLEMFRDGSLKGIGVMGKEITDDERKFLADTVARSGKIFKDLVREKRPDVKEETMQGQWFDAAHGQQLGLVDIIVKSEAEVDTELRAGLPA